MSKHKVVITGINTSNLPLLSNEQTLELLKKDLNDKKTFDLIVEGNLRLVLSVVKKFKDRYDNLDDLFQIGCVGLIKSINKFDLSYNLCFSTYAVPMIRGEIKRYLRDNTPIRISRQLKDIAYQALKFKDEYINKYSKEPSLKEISTSLNIKESLLNEAMDSIQQISSIYDAVYEEDGDTLYLIDQIKVDDNNIEKVPYLISLKKGLKHLDNYQRKIIYDRYYNDLTQFEIAKEFGISQAQVSRLEKNAIEVLKKYM